MSSEKDVIVKKMRTDRLIAISLKAATVPKKKRSSTGTDLLNMSWKTIIKQAIGRIDFNLLVRGYWNGIPTRIIRKRITDREGILLIKKTKKLKRNNPSIFITVSDFFIVMVEDFWFQVV